MGRSPPPSPPARARDVAVYAGVLALFVCALIERPPYDDAYFFKRLALNALDHGILAWNVAEGPVYGVTSQLYQAIEVVLTALSREYNVFVTRLFLCVCLAAGYAAMLAATRARDGGLAATFLFCSPVVLYTAVSGMETALVFALLAALLWLLYTNAGRRLHWSLAPLTVVAVWLTRPDAILLALPPLAAERWGSTGRFPLRELALLATLLGAALLFLRLYYGTALPLPFYAKQQLLSPYDADFLRVSAAVKQLRLGLFLAFAAPLAVVALALRDRVNQWLLGSVAAFEAYHVATTIEVMGMQGRFYAPALPLLALAASRAATGWRAARAATLSLTAYALLGAVLIAVGWLPPPEVGPGEGVPLGFYVAGTVGALILFGALASEKLRRLGVTATLSAAAAAIVIAWHPRLRAPPADDEYLDRHTATSTVYRGMDVLRACFGDAIHVYHSEIGVPGLRFARGEVSDFAGLMSPDWLFQRRSIEESCQTDQPEAIFLPHKNYVTLNRVVLESRCLSGYVRVVRHSSSPLYVRRDLVARYRACEAGAQPH